MEEKILLTILWLKRLPARHGPPPVERSIKFDESKSRGDVLMLLGLDPKLSDEKLKEYKTQFSSGFKNILDGPKDESEDNSQVSEIPVLDYLKRELDEKRVYTDHINEIYKQDYDRHVKRWNSEGTAEEALHTNSLDKERDCKLISSRIDFVHWLTETTYKGIVNDSKDIDLDKYKVLSYEVGKWIVLVRPDLLDDVAYVQSHKEFVSEVEMDPSKRFDDNVISVLQLKTLDGAHHSFNLANVINKMVDRELSPEQKTFSYNPNEFDSFFVSGDVVNDDVGSNVNGLFKELHLL